MKVEIIPLDFLGQGALITPVDQQLHDMAVEYCRKEILAPVDFSKFNKVWVAVRVEDGAYAEICGITGYVTRLDVPMFRVTGDYGVRSTSLLIERMRCFFMDQGCRGHEVFFHVSDKELPEQRCEKWQESIEAAGAVPANRFVVKV